MRGLDDDQAGKRPNENACRFLANSKVEDALNAIAASIERMSDEQTPDIPRDRRAIQTVKNHNSQF